MSKAKKIVSSSIKTLKRLCKATLNGFFNYKKLMSPKNIIYMLDYVDFLC